MDGEYQPLQIQEAPPRGQGETAEGKYWKRFASPVTIQQIGIVSHIDYSPEPPHDFAITSSTRVLVYDGKTHKLKKTVARFPDTAYCGVFRTDGALLAAGCETGLVQVFDLASRSILRQFKTHKRPTHAVHFAHDKTHVVSGSDDATVRWWDLAQGEQVARFDGHTDYIRCAMCATQDTVATGSYDHSLKLWDVRTKEAVMTLEHGSPVEDLTIFLGARMAASAGGTSVAMWDLAAGGKPLNRITCHQKTVTSVSVVNVQDADGRTSVRVLSSALDGHVKVHDLSTFKVAYAYRYPAPVTSAAVAPDLTCMAAGMSDRTLVVRKHQNPHGTLAPAGESEPPLTRKQRRYEPRLTAASYWYFTRGMNSKPMENEVVVRAQRRVQLKAYDKMLKAFRYGDALDAALEHGQVDILLSMVEELAAREGLTNAIKSRDEASVVKLMAMLNKYVAHPDHAATVMQVLNCVFDMHSDMLLESQALMRLIEDLQGRIGAEVKVMQEMQALAGPIQLLLG